MLLGSDSCALVHFAKQKIQRAGFGIGLDLVIPSAIALLVAGAVGVGISYPFVNGMMGKAIEENMSAWFPSFRVEPKVAIVSMLIAIALAVISALIPAIQAGRITVTDALRRVG